MPTIPTATAFRALGVPLETGGPEDADDALQPAIQERVAEMYDDSDSADGRHAVAVGLVLALTVWGGYPWGEPPDEMHARYGQAEDVVRAFCGQAPLRSDSERPYPTIAEDPERASEAIDLAIRLICDPRPVAVLVADAVATLLSSSYHAGKEAAASISARARRMLRVVAPREA